MSQEIPKGPYSVKISETSSSNLSVGGEKPTPDDPGCALPRCPTVDWDVHPSGHQWRAIHRDGRISKAFFHLSNVKPIWLEGLDAVIGKAEHGWQLADMDCKDFADAGQEFDRPWRDADERRETFAMIRDFAIAERDRLNSAGTTRR